MTRGHLDGPFPNEQDVLDAAASVEYDSDSDIEEDDGADVHSPSVSSPNNTQGSSPLFHV